MTGTEQLTSDPARAAEVLLAGGIIGLPTETVYGLGAMALNEMAVHRVFDVKGRPRNHPLIVHLHDLAHAGRWGHMNDNAARLAAALWPGPLTLLLPKTDLVPYSVTGGRETVAIRVPAHPLALEALALVDSGVVAPSANRFGKVSPTTAGHVARDLGTDVDLILDGGPCSVGLESTIVECIGRDVQILRPGAITALDVMSILEMPLAETNSESRAPGMLLSHYAPDATVVLVNSMDEAFGRMQEMANRGITCRILWHEDVERYALSLYDELRTADIDGVHTVIAVLPSRHGIGEAVRDRLHKAAGGR